MKILYFHIIVKKLLHNINNITFLLIRQDYKPGPARHQKNYKKEAHTRPADRAGPGFHGLARPVQVFTLKKA